MSVVPSTLSRAAAGVGFRPYASEAPSLDAYDYIHEEWVAEGVVQGETYRTTLVVHRPRDAARFSGTIVVESLHVHGIAPIWLYTGEYIVRSGHAWVCATVQKTTLDMHVKGSNPERYADMHIAGPDSADFDPTLQLGSAERMESFWSELERRNSAASPILAQVGEALRSPDGPFEGMVVRNVLAAGHSQTGSVLSYYMRDVHHVVRREDGSAIYDGLFPTGFPFDAYRNAGVPVIHVMSEGDVARPDFAFRGRYAGRSYRRDDSDESGDQYRLYELAGVAHMGTRVAPYNDAALWTATFPDEPDMELGPRMNSLPHFELFGMALDHLVRWVDAGVVPPRAPRLELAADGYFVADDYGNTRGGVRCAQMDVPHSRYCANPLGADGRPTYITVGVEVPFTAEQLRSIYGDRAAYLARFSARLDELVADGWFLAADASAAIAEASAIEF